MEISASTIVLSCASSGFSSDRHFTSSIRGIWAMRFVETVLGILAIIASSWSARKVIGKPFAVTAMVPVIVASNRCFPSAVLNYTLASLWVILLIGMTASLIRTTPNGFSGKQLFVWSFLVALAPLTRTSTIPIMCLCGLMVIIHLVLSKCRTLRIWLTSVILPLLLAIVSSVWFYIRLYRFLDHLPERNRSGQVPI